METTSASYNRISSRDIKVEFQTIARIHGIDSPESWKYLQQHESDQELLEFAAVLEILAINSKRIQEAQALGRKTT